MRWQSLIIIFFVGIGFLAPILSPYDPMHANPSVQLHPPDSNHFLGTDTLGRDVLSRLLYGGQRTLFVAALATVIAVGVGAILGITSGIANSFGNYILSGITNLFLAFPSLLIALIILTILGIGPFPLSIATGVAQIGVFARVSRTTAIRIRSQPYIESGYTIGATRWHVLWFYILPNAQTTLQSYAAITFCYCLMNSSSLSFLGLGGEPGISDWGAMLAEGRIAFLNAPWLAIAPGLAIALVVWAVMSWVSQSTIAHFESAAY